jgi:hypothetical protein
MNRKQFIIISALGGAILVALCVLIWKLSVPASSAQTAADTVATAASTSTAGSVTSPTGAAAPQLGSGVGVGTAPRELAPWEKTNLPGGAPRISNLSGADADKAKSYQILQAKLAAMTAGGKTPAMKDLDAVLADLQKINGSTDVAGVNLSALRNNLARADEIQRLGKEMQALSQAPGKQDLPKIQSIMAEIQKQQAGMVTDVRSSPAK